MPVNGGSCPRGVPQDSGPKVNIVGKECWKGRGVCSGGSDFALIDARLVTWAMVKLNLVKIHQHFPK